TLFADGGTPGATGVITAPVSGGDLTKDGAGTWALSSDGNNYANTIINNGTLSMGFGGNTGTLGAGTLLVNAAGTFAINRSDALTCSNVIAGDGAFAKNGNGSVTLTANNTFAGPVSLARGVIRVVNNNTIFGLGSKTIFVDSRNKGIDLDGGVTG